jgi:arginine decarboxylase
MPIHHLKKKRVRPATLWDITCDSDGEMSFDKESPTYLHNVDLEEENYFLGFFLLGAYQETLGMYHNLFSRPNELVIDITKSSYNVKTINYSENLLTILSGINYVKEDIVGMLHQKVEDNSGLTREDREKLFVELAHYMHENGYLKTTR